MKNRLNSGSIGRARRVLLIGVPAVGLAVAMVSVVPTQQAFAQDNGGGSIDIGASIAATVTGAVESIATDSEPSTLFGGLLTESNNLDFGEEDTGTAISDASGGDSNVSVNPSRNAHDE